LREVAPPLGVPASKPMLVHTSVVTDFRDTLASDGKDCKRLVSKTGAPGSTS
jgi:hypothetical protein